MLKYGAVIVFVAMTFAVVASDQSRVIESTAPLIGSKAGVDASDHLWIWSSVSQMVRSISPGGEDIKSARLPIAISVDADTSRGIAVLQLDGQTVQIITWQGAVANTFRLSETAGDIAWLDGALVATTPLFGNHRIAIWNTLTGSLVKTVGAVPTITRGPGPHLARATLVRYQGLRNEILSLDGTFGNVYVYDAAGVLTRQGRLPNPTTAVQQWFDDSGSDAPESRTAVVWRYSSMNVAPDGVLWIGGDSDPNGTVLFAYGTDGSIRTVTVSGPQCINARPVVWGKTMALYIDERSPHARCTSMFDYETVARGENVSATVIGETYPAISKIPFDIQPNATPPTVCGHAFSANHFTASCSCSSYSCPAFSSYSLLWSSCVEHSDSCALVCSYTKYCW